MAKSSKRKTSTPSQQVTASGIVEAIEQDVELSVEQVAQAAKDAVEAVEKKLGVRKSAKRKTTRRKKRN